MKMPQSCHISKREPGTKRTFKRPSNAFKRKYTHTLSPIAM